MLLARTFLIRIASVFSAVVFALLGFGLQVFGKPFDGNSTSQGEPDITSVNSMNEMEVQGNHVVDDTSQIVDYNNILKVILEFIERHRPIPTVKADDTSLVQDIDVSDVCIVFNPAIGNHRFNYTSVF